MGDGVSRADISAPTLRPNQCRSIGGGARGYTLDVGKGGQAQGPPPPPKYARGAADYTRFKFGTPLAIGLLWTVCLPGM